jgi:hypothetical protein
MHDFFHLLFLFYVNFLLFPKHAFHTRHHFLTPICYQYKTAEVTASGQRQSNKLVVLSKSQCTALHAEPLRMLHSIVYLLDKKGIWVRHKLIEIEDGDIGVGDKKVQVQTL